MELPLIATLGCGLILQNVVALLFGSKAMVFPAGLRAYLRIGGALVPEGLLISFGVALALIAGLELLVRRSGFGRQMRAAAQNRNAAEIRGINATSVVVLSMALTAALAAVAGLLVGFSYGLVSPFLGLTYAIKGLIAMIIGGVGSITGAALGTLGSG